METSTIEQQTAPGIPTPQAQHRWLEQFVGEWTYEGECELAMQDDNRMSGVQTVRSLGGLWITLDGQGRIPGGTPAQMHIVLGFDPTKNRFVGSSVCSMMAEIWNYDGELSADERTLSLFAEGPDCRKPGQISQFKDVIEKIDDNHHTFTAYVLENGQWLKMMSLRYQRRS